MERDSEGLTALVPTPDRVKPEKSLRRPSSGLQKNSCISALTKHAIPFIWQVLPIILTQLTSVVGQDQDQLMTLIDQTVSIQTVKNIFLIEKYSIMETPLHLLELASAIDELKYKLRNLQYTSDYERMRPDIVYGTVTRRDSYQKVKTIQVKTIYLDSIISIGDGSKICQSKNLKPIGLDNFPETYPKELLLNLEVSVDHYQITCTYSDIVKRNDECITYILSRTQHRTFFRAKELLKQHILKNDGKKLFLHCTPTACSLIPVPYGKMGCQGENAEVSHDPSSLHIHGQFHLSLNNLYQKIFYLLEAMVDTLTESVDILSADSFSPIGTLVAPSALVDKITGIFPRKLTNAKFQTGIFPDFEKFFSEQLGSIDDQALLLFSQKENLIRFGSRDLKKIYAIVEHFAYTLKFRLSNFLIHFSDQNFNALIPNTVLFERDQNPSTFITLMRQLFPGIDSHVLHDSFAIIQNCKAKLLHNLRHFQVTITDTKYIDFRTRELSKKGQAIRPIKLDQINRFDITKQTEHPLSDQQFDADSFLEDESNFQAHNQAPVLPTPPSQVLVTPTRLSSQLTEEDLRHFAHNDPGPDPGRMTPPGANSNNDVFRENFSQDFFTREKRSGFLTSVFGIATTDDLVQLYQQEVKIHNREEQVELQVQNMTFITNSVIKAVKNMSLDMELLGKNSVKLYRSIEKLNEQETDTLKKFAQLASSLDRLLVLTAEYSNMNLQIVLVLHMATKIHHQIQSALLNSVDITRVPIDVLSKLATPNIRVALRAVQTQFIVIKGAYNIRYRVPTLSYPFQLYHIRTIPIYYKGLWTRANIEPYLILNSVSDMLDISEVERFCSPVDNYIICSPKSLTVRHSTSSCSYEIILGRWEKVKNYPSCKFTQIMPHQGEQSSIFTGKGLTISSSIEDRLIYTCERDSDQKEMYIPVGLSNFPIKQNCIYETSQLTIFNNPNIESKIDIRDSADELDLSLALSELDNLLSDLFSEENFNLTKVQELLQAYKNEEQGFSVSLDKFKKDVATDQQLKEIQKFNPIQFNLVQPFHKNNVLSVIFWIIIIFIVVLSIGCCYMVCPCLCPVACESCRLACQGWWKICQSCKICPDGNLAIRNELELADFAGQSEPFVGDLPTAPSRTIDISSKGENRLMGNITPHHTPQPLRHSSLERLNRIGRDLPPIPANIRYPDLQEIYSTTSPVHSWKITKGKLGQFVMESHIPTGSGARIRLTYDPFEGKVLDRYGCHLSYVKVPDEAMIRAFEDLISKSGAPPSFRDALGIIRLMVHPKIVYNIDTDRWVDTETNSVIHGLPSFTNQQA